MAKVLTAENIIKYFYTPSKIEIIKGVSLSLDEEKSLAIVGKSGEGKTTLLHILGTIDDATEGRIEILGHEVTKRNKEHLRGQHIGFVFQAFHLIEDLSCLENILLPATIARQSIVKGSPYYKRALELATNVGLEHRLHFAANKLSGGERQRVAIARAFINNPDIIFADEPTGNLDHETAKEIQKLLLDTTKVHKKALFLVTHNLELAKLLDSCYELEDGKLRVIDGRKNSSSSTPLPH
jgi:lipoprotein-releasing system ATP-binding protein